VLEQGRPPAVRLVHTQCGFMCPLAVGIPLVWSLALQPALAGSQCAGCGCTEAPAVAAARDAQYVLHFLFITIQLASLPNQHHQVPVASGRSPGYERHRMKDCNALQLHLPATRILTAAVDACVPVAPDCRSEKRFQRPRDDGGYQFCKCRNALHKE